MSHRPTVYGTRHAVSAGHYLAAAAGFSMLEAGGNAIDAGCAAGIALGVLQPDLVNVAGVAPIIIRLADGRWRASPASAGGPSPSRRSVHARARRQNPRRRAAHRRARRPRCLDHRVAPARHDALRRCRRAGDPFRRRGVFRSIRCWPPRSRRTSTNTAAGNPTPRSSCPTAACRARAKNSCSPTCAHAAVHGRPGSRRRPRPHRRTERRARRVLSRRHRAGDREVPEAGRRLPVDGRPGLRIAHRSNRWCAGTGAATS